MNGDTEYWKELFGDDYNEELMQMVKNPSQPDKPADKSGDKSKSNEFLENPPDNIDDAAGFRDYNAMLDGIPAPSNAGTNKPAAGKGGGKNDKADDFSVNFDFEGEYRDVPDNRPLKPRREKRTGCLGGIIYAVFIICICLLLASLLWLAATDVLGLGNENEKVQVTIPEDYTMNEVSEILYKSGLIKYEFLFKIYTDFSEAEENITPGTYELNKNYDYRALVNAMNIHSGKRVEIDVTIPEGYTLKEIFVLFDANKVCTEKELWAAAADYDFKYDFLDSGTLGDKYRLEGYLFPDTYTFYVGDTPIRALSKLLDNFKAKFKAEYITRAQELGYSIRDIVSIAAMIEREAGADSDRDLISSVIYNRLNSKSLKKLQIDATIWYAIAETGEAFSTDVDSPYNTYMVEGLPAGPISNPGINSIRAALYPQTTKYYYYALNKSGTHNFFKDFDSQQAFVHSDEYGG